MLGQEKLVPVPKPRAAIQLFESQMPLTQDGVTVERYTTGRGTVFEKHIGPNGVTHWFLVTKVG